MRLPRPLRAFLPAALAPLLGVSIFACTASDGDPPARSPEATARTAQAYTGDVLQQYSQACDQTIGLTVPKIDCDNAGITIPITVNGQIVIGPPGTTVAQCDHPDEFSGECVTGQKLVPLATASDKIAFAICRRFSGSPGSTNYDAIEVLQYNKTNGASCWYATPFGVPGQVPPPSQGLVSNGQTVWQKPADVANLERCVGCHDDGAILRSPFVKQVAKSLPGNPLAMDDDTFNKNTPYRFVGADFAAANWYAASITDGDSTCTSCHRLGVNQFIRGPGLALSQRSGTAAQLGIYAVECTDPSACTLADYVPPGQDAKAPHWMIPPAQQSFSPALLASAHAIAHCADEYFTANIQTPPGPPMQYPCVATRYTDFSPLVHLPKLAMWLDASRGVSSNLFGGVITWNDQTPNGNDASRFTTMGPVAGSGSYGAYIAFSTRMFGSTPYATELQVPSTNPNPNALSVSVGTNDFALVVVANYATESYPELLVSKQALGYPYRGFGAFATPYGGAFEGQLGADAEFFQYLPVLFFGTGNFEPDYGDSPHVVGGKPHVFAIRRVTTPGGVLLETRVDGVPSSVPLTGQPALDLTSTVPLEIGLRQGSGMQLLGEIYDVMLVQDLVSDWDMGQLEAYLKTRHDL